MTPVEYMGSVAGLFTGSFWLAVGSSDGAAANCSWHHSNIPAARSMSSTPVTPGEHGPLIPRCAGTLAVGSTDLKLKKEGHIKNK